MSVTDEQRAELRRLAEAATPGPWAYAPISAESELGKHLPRRTEQEEADARYIAAADPAAVLALLDERDALAAEVERLRGCLECGGWGWLGGPNGLPVSCPECGHER